MTKTLRMRALVLMLSAVVCGAGCDGCGGDGVGSASAGFRTEVQELDFGKVLENGEVTRAVELIATGRTGVTVTATTTGPFRSASEMEVPGGGRARLDVTFTAPNGDAEGVLTLSVRDERFDIALRGRGVRPLTCVASQPCRESRFVLESESCEETVSKEGAECTPASLCLENGQCRQGVCVGTARACDDNNVCTQDACSEDVGCVNVDISSTCPRPQNPCLAATCDPVGGCGTVQREDDFICGTVDCKVAHVCAAGTCREVATPEGFLCAPATPCQGEGHCTAGECVRPDAGEMMPSWSVSLGAAPAPSPGDGGVPLPDVEVGRFVSVNGNIFFSACGLAAQDGGCALLSYTSNGFQRFAEPLPESGGTVHGVFPGGVLVDTADTLRGFASGTGAPLWSLSLSTFDGEAGAHTIAVVPRRSVAMTSDGRILAALSFASAERPDGGVTDAGMADGGIGADGGLDDDGGTTDGGGNDAGMGDGGADDAGSVDAGDFDSDGGVDAGGGSPRPGALLVRLEGDGGVLSTEWVSEAAHGSRLGLSASDGWRLHAVGAAKLVAEASPDAGMSASPRVVQGVSGFGVSVGADLLALTSSAAVFDDGGVRPLLAPREDGIGEVAIDFDVLNAGGEAFVFFRACDPTLGEPCTDDQLAIWVRAFGGGTLSPLWATTVLPSGTEGALVEARVMTGMFQGAVATLSRVRLGGLPYAHLQLFAAGQRLMMCPLQGNPLLMGGLFEQQQLFVIVEREGELRLEAYALVGGTFAESGWPRPSGVGGARRER